ncbi:inositol monophosphatase family protein [Frondihabitans australicus]|uniref:Myo-inositol-1(Or 4)-monophosphatase/deoxyribonuclease-2 n=1 Tax=Frondihabitans australicus TaxID=386892 RepID=A0A495ING2_9MICO|nr:inositol monophosphatase family protein [Frondihabitans australicus]RKR76696.1 myo-inositol-1(or 4)-monophosphatase/deoxyribonuclease-2 [Frondihabitans australicus]
MTAPTEARRATTALAAHRGDSSRFRENTVAAIESALEAGAPTIEIDVRTTQDSEVILLHDATLERLWGLDSRIADLTWPEVCELGGGDLRIPRLADVLPLFEGSPSTLLIDMDSTGPALAAQAVVAACAAAARERGASPANVAWCGLLDAMRLIREADADAAIWMPWADSEPPTAADLEGLAPSVVNLPHLVVGPALVDAVHALGARVSCWTVDDVVQARHLQAIGVDSITTNRLQDLRDALGDGALATGTPAAEAAESPADSRRRARLVASALGSWAIEYVRTHPVGDVATKKNPADHVTEIDRAIERGVRAVIGAQFPEHSFVGEEYGGSADGGPCWYLDPVDGTANLANGVPWTSFSLALVEGGVPVVAVVADPWRGVVVEAQAGEGAWVGSRRLLLPEADWDRSVDPLRGAIVSTELAGHRPWHGMLDLVDALADRFCTTRIMGSGTLTLAGVALGHGAGAVIGSFGAVDHLAAALIVREAGGVVLDENGRDTLFPSWGGILAARDRRTAEALFALWRNGIACDASRG